MTGWTVLVVFLVQLAVPALAADSVGTDPAGPEGFSILTGESLFESGTSPWVDTGGLDQDWTQERLDRLDECGTYQFRTWQLTTGAPRPWTLDGQLSSYQMSAANSGANDFPQNIDLTYWNDPRYSETETLSTGRMFFRGWVLITGFEMVLLAITATLPKSWTGWSSQFVKDGWGNMKDAYTSPPVWDTDHWFHNYIGHPYGGSVYYNTMRCQGGDKGHSFLFSMALSVQWEYIFEAVAEQPSIQDLLITPFIGSLMGEAVHSFTSYLRKGGTNFGEKVIITILNPTSVFFNGYD